MSSIDDISRRKALAYGIATDAGSNMLDLFHKNLKQTEKTKNDYVSELDRKIESKAMEAVLEAFPDDGFSGEENPGQEGKSSYSWIVDPIDGTNNYLRGLPLCGFQLAIMQNRQTVYSVIYRPFTQEYFMANKGEGAVYKNLFTGEESSLRVSNRNISESLVIYDSAVGRSNNFSTDALLSLADNTASTRVFGVAAFDIPAIAAGTAEVLVTGIAQPYDIAPGALLVEEAGGELYNLNGESPSLEDNLMIISNKKVKTDLLELLRDEN